MLCCCAVYGMPARYESSCCACGKPIGKGDRIVKDFNVRRFVHAACMPSSYTSIPHLQHNTLPTAHATYIYARQPLTPHQHQPHSPPPHDRHDGQMAEAEQQPGFTQDAARTLQQQHAAMIGQPPTLHLHPDHRRPKSYISEVNSYIGFFSSEGYIPGIHGPFTHETVERYLEFRGRSTKALWEIITKLRWMGVVYSHRLPDKFGSGLLHARIKDSIRRIKGRIRDDKKAKKLPTKPNRALGLDNNYVAVVASHRRCFNRRHMAMMQWEDIVHTTQLFMSHSGCMRYGHFSKQDIPRTALFRAPMAEAWRLESDWAKFDNTGPAVILFRDMPTAQPAVYTLRRPGRGATREVRVTAAMVISWYITIRDQRFPDHPLLFPDMPSFSQRRSKFHAWLRSSIAAAIPDFAHLRTVKPHGLRAGWVCDRRKEGTPDNTIMREGRWRSQDAMGIYDRTAFSDVCPVNTIVYTPEPRDEGRHQR